MGNIVTPAARQAATSPTGPQIVRLWVFVSAGLMVIGAFGPWVKTLGQSVGGTDGSNDGWLVLIAAVVGAVLFYAMRRRRGAALWVLLGGVVGAAVTIYDRSNLQDRINRAGAFAQALVHVGWGLNLALAASISLAIAGLVYLFVSPDVRQDWVPASPGPPPPSPSVPPSPPGAPGGMPTPPNPLTPPPSPPSPE